MPEMGTSCGMPEIRFEAEGFIVSGVDVSAEHEIAVMLARIKKHRGRRCFSLFKILSCVKELLQLAKDSFLVRNFDRKFHGLHDFRFRCKWLRHEQIFLCSRVRYLAIRPNDQGVKNLPIDAMVRRWGNLLI